ncbi:hypothetical protein C8F01DRAFT_1104128 [Mycena amicta]|nr:hypothetical protein C8F01DRAFT_1104128 [Mycena amicta]
MSSNTRPSHPRQSSIDQQASQLEEKLAHRPDKATLVDRNILKDDKGLAPGLVAARDKLKRSQLEDQLSTAIANRPTKAELEKNGILPPDEEETPASA